MLKKLALSTAALGLAAAGTVVLSSPAAAAASYDPNVTRIANPANVCKGILGSVPLIAEAFGAPAPDLSSFDYAGCVKAAGKGTLFAEGPDGGDPYEQCDFLTGVGAFSYGAVLHSGEDGEIDAFLPDLKVNDRKQCGNALYAYHTIFSLLGPPPGDV